MKFIINKLSLLFSLEMVFSLFLLSAVFKESIAIPFDLSLLLFVVVVGVCLFRLMRNPTLPLVSLFPTVVFLMLSSLVMVSYIYAPASQYSADKVIKFFLFTFTSFFVPLFFFKKGISVKKFINSTFIITLILTVYTLVMIVSNDSTQNFIAFNEGNYLGLGRAIGLCAVILLCKYLFSEKKIVSLLSFILLPVVLYSLLSVGARMPLLGIFLVLLCMIPMTTIRIKKLNITISKSFKKMLFILIVAVTVIFYFVNSGYTSKTIDRISILFTQQGGGDSASGRVDRYISSIQLFGENPLFGGGIGSFSLFFDGKDMRDYSHNIFLEMLSELGIFGLVLISILLIGGFVIGRKRIKQIKEDTQYEYTLLFLYVFYFVNANVTGDINDNRFLFALLGCLFMNRDASQNLINSFKKLTWK